MARLSKSVVTAVVLAILATIGDVPSAAAQDGDWKFVVAPYFTTESAVRKRTQVCRSARGSVARLAAYFPLNSSLDQSRLPGTHAGPDADGQRGYGTIARRQRQGAVREIDVHKTDVHAQAAGQGHL